MKHSTTIIMSLSALALLGGCTSPAGYKYKFSPYEPATSSLWDSYSNGISNEYHATTNIISSGIRTNFTIVDPAI